MYCIQGITISWNADFPSELWRRENSGTAFQGWVNTAQQEFYMRYNIFQKLAQRHFQSKETKNSLVTNLHYKIWQRECFRLKKNDLTQKLGRASEMFICVCTKTLMFSFFLSAYLHKQKHLMFIFFLLMSL